jgi:hypothetical protein
MQATNEAWLAGLILLLRSPLEAATTSVAACRRLALST